jgi:hypothetical protein
MEARNALKQRAGAWMRANLTTQGYRLTDDDRRRLALGLRFSTGTWHAFKVATAWLLVVGALLAAGATTVALVLGGLLVAACATVTAMNLCLPSVALAWWERRTTRKEVIIT